MALVPNASVGRPSKCTMPCESMEVTPPCSAPSIQPMTDCRGFQSPNIGWTCGSINPGITVIPSASISVATCSRFRSLRLPIAVILPASVSIESPSSRGLSMSPEAMVPILVMSSVLLFILVSLLGFLHVEGIWGEELFDRDRTFQQALLIEIADKRLDRFPVRLDSERPDVVA